MFQTSSHLLFDKNYAGFDSRQLPLKIYQFWLGYRWKFIKEWICRKDELIEKSLHAFSVECCHSKLLYFIFAAKE